MIQREHKTLTVPKDILEPVILSVNLCILSYKYINYIDIIIVFLNNFYSTGYTQLWHAATLTNQCWEWPLLWPINVENGHNSSCFDLLSQSSCGTISLGSVRIDLAYTWVIFTIIEHPKSLLFVGPKDCIVNQPWTWLW